MQLLTLLSLILDSIQVSRSRELLVSSTTFRIFSELSVWISLTMFDVVDWMYTYLFTSNFTSVQTARH